MPHLISDQAYAAIRTLARGVLGNVTTQEDDRSLAEDVQRYLRTAEPIDDAEVKEFAEWARSVSRLAAAGERVRVAQDHAVRMVKSADRLLVALAMVRMNPDAVDRRGERDGE